MAVRPRPAAIAVAVFAVASLAGCGATIPRRPAPVTCSSDAPSRRGAHRSRHAALRRHGRSGAAHRPDDRHHVVRVTVTAVDRVPRAEVDFLSAQDLGSDVDPDTIDIYAVHALARLSKPADLDPLRDLLLYSREHDFADPHVLSTWSPEGCEHRQFAPSMPAGTTIRTCDWVCGHPRGRPDRGDARLRDRRLRGLRRQPGELVAARRRAISRLRP